MRRRRRKTGLCVSFSSSSSHLGVRFFPMILRLKQREIVFPRRPLVMGIVNLNGDSFSGDGIRNVNEAIRHAGRLISERADLIDVGGESARTDRLEVTEQQETDLVAPFTVRVRACYARLRPLHC